MASTPSIDDLRIDRSDEDTSRRSRTGLWVGLLLVAVLAAAVWYWWQRPPVLPVETAAVVEVSADQAAAAGAVLDASGYVTARRRAVVSSKVTGKIVEVLVDEGLAVRQGQVLARLDASTVQRQLTLARAELDAAHRVLPEIEVRLDEARLELGRQQRLTAADASARAELDRAQAEVDALQARLEQARQQIDVAAGRLALRQQELEDTVIRAPFDGVVVTKDAQPGEMISPVSAGGGFTRTGVCTVVDMSSLEIEVDVNEAYINRVQSGQPVLATLDAYPDWQIPAEVITPVPTADRQKATVMVRIRFQELDARILPDMGIKVAFLDAESEAESADTSAEASSELLMPSAAVRDENGAQVVFVLRGDRVERRAVRLGAERGGAGRGERVVVLAGVTAADRVVVDPPVELVDGARVRVD